MLMIKEVPQFSFWTPVVFPQKDDTKFSGLLWRIGSWADRFASWTPKQINVDSIEQVNVRKFSFKAYEVDVQTNKAIKVAAYILTAGILLAVAFLIKAIFKMKLNELTTLKSPNELMAEK